MQSHNEGKKMKRFSVQLEEEVEQKKAPVILYNVSEGKK